MRRIKVAMLATFFGALTAAGPASAQNWIQHDDKHGFRISHPQGWVVETPDDKTVYAHSPDGSSVVLIHAFFEKTSVGARQWMQNVPAKFASVFGRAKLGQVRERRAGDAVGQLEYSGRWGDCKASMLVSIQQGSGMLFAIGAPEFQYEPRKNDLIRVVQSFTVTGAPGQAGGQSAGAAASAPNLRYQRFTDPKEGAFTVEVPAGWNVQGGTFRRSAVDVKQWLKLNSPDGRITLWLHEPQLPGIFILPVQGMPAYNNPSAPTAAYMTGVQFAEFVLRRFYLPGINVQIVDRRNRTDLQQQMAAVLQRYAVAGVQQAVTYGEISFQFERGGQKYVGTLLAGTQGTLISGTGSWFPLVLGGWAAPADQVNIALAVQEHGQQTYAPNGDWVRAQQGTTAKVSQITRETNDYVSKLRNDSYWARQQSNDRISERRSDVNRGRVRLEDPYTGERYEAVSGKNYYYVHAPTGGVVGTNNTDRPNIDVTELRQVW
ncbi:MAG: hypothetical protein ABI823_14590 [Bryobacteraceae bacterium]